MVCFFDWLEPKRYMDLPDWHLRKGNQKERLITPRKPFFPTEGNGEVMALDGRSAYMTKLVDFMDKALLKGSNLRAPRDKIERAKMGNRTNDLSA